MADVDNLLALYGNSNITNSSGQQVSAKGSVFEMARYFNFNTSDTDEVTISFVLFNTIVKNGVVDQWKRNLYFISLFNLRNLPFKLDYTTYLPPLLYDVIIPGVKRLPFAYVSSFSAVPQGMIRNMKIENFLAAIAGVDTNENKQISTPVPEAWTISITFKSMIARTANLMLAGGADLPITINMSESNAADKDKSLSEYKQMMKEMEEEQQKKAIAESIKQNGTLTFDPKDVMSDVNEMQNEQFVTLGSEDQTERSIFDEERTRIQQTRVTAGELLDTQTKSQKQTVVQQQSSKQKDSVLKSTIRGVIDSISSAIAK